MQPEIDYYKIGNRIRKARMEKNLSQADLGALLGCSNNHVSHIETGQTKVSLPTLLRLTHVLDKDFDYFLMDTPYVTSYKLIDKEISEKLKRCNVNTLLSISRIIDVLLEQQDSLLSETCCV